MSEVRRFVDWLIVDFDDHLPGAESRLVTATPFFNRAHQHPVAALYPKKLSQLRTDIFNHQPAARRGMHNHHRNRQIEVRHVGHLWHLRHVYVALRLPRHRLLAVRKLHLDGQRLAVTANAKTHHAAGRRFFYHPSQLGGALYRCTIYAYDYVMVM